MANAPWEDEMPPTKKPTPKAKAKTSKPKVSAAAQKIIDEYEDFDISEVKATGANNTITKGDIQRYLDSFDEEDDEGGEVQPPNQEQQSDEPATVPQTAAELGEYPDDPNGHIPFNAPGEEHAHAAAEEFTDEQQELLDEWIKASAYIESIKPWIEAERQLRKRVVEAFFANKGEGTHYYDLPDGEKLKAVRRLERKVDAAALVALRDELNAIDLKSGDFTQIQLFLNTRTYKKLPLAHQRVIDRALEIKESSPQLEVITANPEA